MTHRFVRSCLAAGLAALLTACSGPAGPATARVQGEVSFNGKPIPEGTITFEGTDGASPAQGAIKDGHFDIPAEAGPVVDKEYLVKVNAMAKTGKTVKNIMDETSPTMEVMVETIPPVFNSQSSIKKTISADPAKNQFTFKLMPSGAYE